MTGTVLLTLGRLPKGLDLARSFGQAGWRVVVADPHPRHVVGASRYVSRSFRVAAPAREPVRFLDDLAAIVARENVDLVVPVSEEILYVAGLHGRLDPRVRIFAMAQHRLVELHDKARFVEMAGELGLHAPASALGGACGAQELAASGDVIVKPRHGCAGGGVQRLRKGAHVDANASMLVQRLVSGVEHSACALAADGRVQGCAIYRGFSMSGTVAVGFERVDNDAIQAWVEAFIAGHRLTGFISFDFIVDGCGEPWGIECNPRLTSGVHFMKGADIAPAIASGRGQVRLRPEARLQQFWACLSEAQARFGDWPAFRKSFADVFRVRDVSWSARDPAPLLTMPWTAWRIISDSRAGDISFGEAASRDILWTGEASAPAAAKSMSVALT